MILTKSTLEPDDLVIFEVISNNYLSRNKDVCSLIELLENANDFTSIALNGEWGSGKTFFVKQAKMLIDSLDPVGGLNEDWKGKFSEMKETNSGDLQSLIKTSHISALYFDAWLYDDSPDPLKSLLYFLATSFSSAYAKESKAFSTKLTSIIDVLNFWSNGSTRQLLEAFKKNSTIEEIYDLEKLKTQLRYALEEDLILDGQRLVIFVDELDRCNPVFAVKLLERIKHFFNSPKVLFVFSINLEQLSATIKKNYGSEFNSSGYLSKFFDIIIDIPPVPAEKYLSWKGIKRTNKYIDTYYQSLITNLHMSLRQTAKYLDSWKIIYDYLESRSTGFFDEQIVAETLFCPLMLAFKITDMSIYCKFISGKAEELMWENISKWEQSTSYIDRSLFNGKQDTTIEEQKEAVTCFYHAIFGNVKMQKWENINFNIYEGNLSRVRENLLKVCSLINGS